MKGQLERRWIFVLVIIIGLLILFFYPRHGDNKNSDAHNSKAHEERGGTSQQAVGVDNNDGKTQKAAPTVYGKIPMVDGLTAQNIEKARSLAKVTLSSLYTAEKAYIAEFSRPTTDILSLGFTPADSVLHYKAGFLEALETHEYNDITNEGMPTLREDPRRINTDALLEIREEHSQENQEASHRYEYSKEAAGLNLEDYRSYCRIGCKVQGQEFEIMIAVPIDASHIDVWTINNLKQMNLVKDGTRKPQSN